MRMEKLWSNALKVCNFDVYADGLLSAWKVFLSLATQNLITNNKLSEHFTKLRCACAGANN